MDKKALIEQGIDGIDLKYIENAVRGEGNRTEVLRLSRFQKVWLIAAAVIFLALIGGSIFLGTDRYRQGQKPELSVSDPRQAAEDASDVIVIGTNVSPQDSGVTFTNAVTSYRIVSVLKDTTGTVMPGSVIRVLASGQREAPTDAGPSDVIDTDDTDVSYILHLSLDQTNPDIYTPVLLCYGRENQN